MNTDEINVLLERAGCKKVPVTIRAWNTGSRHRAGKQIESLQNTIILHGMHRQALAAALEKVLAERDAAIKAIPRACVYCKHWISPPRIEKTEHGTIAIACENTKCHNISGTNTGWEWRGPKPPKEDA